ncbi:hypothetical protein KRX54_05845 [Actinomycetaceae bacterium TAE3-ERU4]|nr:hypothetical protein [Actinomycetaceae bacterium TAE3-ERU4]
MGKEKKPSFGLVRFGKENRMAAMPVAVFLGLVISALLSLVAVFFHKYELPWWQTFLIYWVCLALATISLVWAVVVDRLTIPGAIKKPEESIEMLWYSKASEISFNALLFVCGVGSLVCGLLGFNYILNVFLLITLVLAVIFGLSYLFVRYRK